MSPGFYGALYSEVSPTYPEKASINDIVGPRSRKRQEFKDSSVKAVTVTIDSGACDSITPSHTFPNTRLSNGADIGKTYGACGGEQVINTGCKQVRYRTAEGTLREHVFQVGNTITRPLLAVSQECAKGHGVWFGPGPKFESYVVNSPNSYVVHDDNITKTHLNSGVYEMDIQEVPDDGLLAANSAEIDGEEAKPIPFWPPQQPAVSDPYMVKEEASDGIAGDTIDEHSKEAAPVRVKNSPAKPSSIDIEKHNASGHLPFRSWCPICVRGRGKEDAHQRKPTSRNTDIPYFTCDYCFLSSESQVEVDEPKRLTVLVIKEHNSKSLFGCVVPHKGITQTDANVNFFLECIDELGNAATNIVIKNDQEPSIVAVINMVKEKRAKAATIIDESPVGSSASNGSIENGVGEYEAQIRVCRLALEQRLGIQIPIHHDIVPWMVRHCGFLLQRYLVGHDGMTAYRRIRHRDYDSDAIEFGETVLYKIAKTHLGPALNKYDSTWSKGVYLGTRVRSNELLTFDTNGIHKVRTVKRVPIDDRWDKDVFSITIAPPWDFKYDSPVEEPAEQQSALINIDSGERLPEPLAEGESHPIVHIDFKIFKKDLEDARFGYTDNCPGCIAARNKSNQRAHSIICRERLRTEFAKYPDTRKRVEMAERRLRPIADNIPQPNEDMDVPMSAPAPQAEPRIDADDVGEDLFWDPDLGNEPDQDEIMGRIGVLANIAIERIKYGHHITEVYSPRRVNREAVQVGLTPGLTLDLTTVDPEDGKPWDFTCKSKRDKARSRIMEERPFLVIGRPPHTKVKTENNDDPLHKERCKRLEVENNIHLQFCIELYNIQIKAGRYFIHEYPQDAHAVAFNNTNQVFNREDVYTIKANMKVYGTMANNQVATNAVVWKTNSSKIAKELNKQKGVEYAMNLTRQISLNGLRPIRWVFSRCWTLGSG